VIKATEHRAKPNKRQSNSAQISGGAGAPLKTKKPPRDAAVGRIDLGARLRQQRLKRGWTLEQASQESGIARSTLSKVEAGSMSPTFDMLQRIAAGMSLDLALLVDTRSTKGSTGRRSLVRKGEGVRVVSGSYQHELLATELSRKKFLPFVTTVTAHSLDEFGEFAQHSGEEFLYVLHGRVELHTEFYSPSLLVEGDSIYFDSGMPHALISSSAEDAEVLWICSDNFEPTKKEGRR
jgi:transcriptional regulator with XRE-family HTH domain